MGKLRVREATRADVGCIAYNLRHADLVELAAANGIGFDIYETIADSFESASVCWVLTAGHTPVVIWGVSPVTGRIGAPWLLASQQMDKLTARQVLKYTKRYMPSMREGYEILANYVHAENQVSIRWLKYAGFAVAKTPTPWGVYGVPFLLFCLKGSL